MTLQMLCEKIGLPSVVAERVLLCPAVPDSILLSLRTPGQWDAGRAALAECLGEDPDGLETLAGHLQCALKTWEIYQKQHISEEIFIETMKCFTRFVREHRQSYGRYGFDRDFWTVRQLSAVLFRIGELEYETVGDAIHLHIPSDSVLEKPRLRRSWEAAREMLGDGEMVCHSWLLSPDLPGLLDGDSRILDFQRNFAIHSPEPDDSFRQWVFKDPGCPDRQLPENTRLQRELKAFVLAGNTFHAAHGTLDPDPFR